MIGPSLLIHTIATIHIYCVSNCWRGFLPSIVYHHHCHNDDDDMMKLIMVIITSALPQMIMVIQYDHLELSKSKFFYLSTETSPKASQCTKSCVYMGHFDISSIWDLQINWKISIGLFVTWDNWRKLEEMHQNRPPQNFLWHFDTSVIP